jgi:hypothetical protein
VVGVIGERVSVPWSALEISSAPPRRWSVVPRPNARFPGVSEYAVCPNCSERVPLTERLARIECRRCRATADVAWDEPYLREA